uniref:putative uncharacterized protein TRPC5OS n=1 Tax=Jaculus jaculus TaxID=51337 RepID=UPI00064D626D|nr:putative uncharacterized protein TRPC5OS [Jaculus jaculus]
MEPVSIPTLVAGLIDCVAQLIRIAEELLEIMSQEQEAAPAQQNGEAKEAEEGASAPDDDSLPDLADLSDLESILSTKDEDLVIDVNEAMIDMNEICEGLLPGIRNERESN